jgi:hypothetical protein
MGRTLEYIESQKATAQANIQSQAAEQRATVEQQAAEVQESLRQSRSQLEQEAQTARGEVYTKKALAQRQSQLAGQEKTAMESKVAAETQMASIKTTEQSVKEEIKAAEKELAVSKAEALASIDTAVEKANAEIEAQAEQSKQELSAMELDNVELDYTDSQGNSEWVSKDFYNSLNTEQKAYLNKNGIDAFKKEYYVTTNQGELVSKEYFKALSTDNQEYLIKNGIDALNSKLVSDSYDIYVSNREAIDKDVSITLEEWKNMSNESRASHLQNSSYDIYKQAAINAGADYISYHDWIGLSSAEQEKTYTDLISDNYTTIKDGIVTNSFFDSLNPEQQEYLTNNGLSAWQSKYITQLSTGEYVSSEFYNSLTEEQKQQLNKLGIDKFQYQQYVDMCIAGNASYITEEDWNSRSEQDRQSLIDTTNKLIQYNIFSGNTQAIGSTPMTVTEWYAQTDSTRSHLLLESGYNIYAMVSNNAGVTPITLSSWIGITDEERTQIYNGVITNNYVTSKTGELYPKNTYTDFKGNVITGFSDLPENYQDAFMANGNAGLQEAINNDKWAIISDIYTTIETSTGLRPSNITQSDWDNMTEEEKNRAYQVATGIYSGYIMEQANSIITQTNLLTGSNFPTYDAKTWSGYSTTEQQNIYADIIDRYGDSLYDSYKTSIEYVNSVFTTSQQPVLSKAEWDKLPTEKQISTYNALVTNVNEANTKVQQDFIASLPITAQNYIQANGFDDFYSKLTTANASSGETAFKQLQEIGVIPSTAVYVSQNEDGSFNYTGGSGIDPKAIDLDTLDISTLTTDDYYSLSIAAWSDSRYRVGRASATLDNVTADELTASLHKYIRTLSPEQQKLFSKLEEKTTQFGYISAISLIIPHFESVRADVTWDDVSSKMTTWDWINEIAVVATLGVGSLASIASTSLVKAGIASLSYMAKTTSAIRAGMSAEKTAAVLQSIRVAQAISKGLSIESRILSGAAALTFTTEEAIQIARGELSVGEIILQTGLNALYLGAVFGSPILKTIKNSLNNMKSTVSASQSAARTLAVGGVSAKGVAQYYVQTAKIIGTSGKVSDVSINAIYSNLADKMSDLTIAVTSGSVKEIKAAAAELKDAAINLKNVVAGTRAEADNFIAISDQVAKDAEIYVNNRGSILEGKVSPEVNDAYNNLETLVKEARMRATVDTNVTAKAGIKTEVNPQEVALEKIEKTLKTEDDKAAITAKAEELTNDIKGVLEEYPKPLWSLDRGLIAIQRYGLDATAAYSEDLIKDTIKLGEADIAKGIKNYTQWLLDNYKYAKYLGRTDIISEDLLKEIIEYLNKNGFTATIEKYGDALINRLAEHIRTGRQDYVINDIKEQLKSRIKGYNRQLAEEVIEKIKKYGLVISKNLKMEDLLKVVSRDTTKVIESLVGEGQKLKARYEPPMPETNIWGNWSREELLIKEAKNVKKHTMVDVATKRIAQTKLDAIGYQINNYGWKSALEMFGKDAVLAYSPKAMEYAMAEIQFIKKNLPSSVVSRTKANKVFQALYKDAIDNNCIPYDVPSTYKLKNGMTVKQALTEIANLDNPTLKLSYDGTMIEIIPKSTVGLKLEYPLYISPRMMNKIIDIQKGMIKGYGEEKGGVFYAYTRKGKNWAIEAKSPVKGIMRYIKGLIKAREYIPEEQTSHIISLTPEQISRYDDIYVEIGTPARWKTVKEEAKDLGIPKVFEDALSDIEDIISYTQIIPVKGKSAREIAENLYKEVIKSVEENGYVYTLAKYGEGITKAVYPNAIESALYEQLEEGGGLSEGSVPSIPFIPTTDPRTGGTTTYKNIADNIVYGIAAVADAKTLWQSVPNKPSAFLFNNQLVLLPSNIGVMPASYIDSGRYAQTLNEVAGKYNVDIASMATNYQKLINIKPTETKTGATVTEKTEISQAEKVDVKLAESIIDSVTKTVQQLNTKKVSKSDIEEKVNQMTQYQIQNIVNQSVKTEVKNEIKDIIANIVIQQQQINVIKIGNYKYYNIILKNGEIIKLTEEQWEGKVGWRQGAFYWLIYPPYGEKDRIVTRKKIVGIPYYSGVKSAYRSIIKMGGKIPYKIFRDLGIFDITITTPKTGKPTIKYKPDIKQRTKYTSKNSIEVSGIR